MEALPLDDEPHGARSPLRRVRDPPRQQEQLPLTDNDVPAGGQSQPDKKTHFPRGLKVVLVIVEGEEDGLNNFFQPKFSSQILKSMTKYQK